MPPMLTSVPFRYLLTRHRLERPSKLAIIDGATGASITYGDLYARVTGIAAGLAAQGIAPGDRVACLALNSKEFAEFSLALAWMGAVMVPLNIRHTATELRFVIQDSGATGMFACHELAELAEAAIGELSSLHLRVLVGGARAGWTDFGDLCVHDAPPGVEGSSVSGDTLAVLLYTSGTTGKPKGCMVPQRTWTGCAINLAACAQMGEADVYLAFLPFFHVAGLGTAMAQLVLGGTIVTAPRAEPRHFYRLIAEHRVSIMFLVPGISAAFVMDPVRETTDLSSLRVFISGAGAEKLELIDAVESSLGARFYGIYGQTEAGNLVTWADSDQSRSDPTTYGRVMPFFEYMIADEGDREVGPGCVGELCVRSSTVMLGYWNDPQATADALRNAWHHTGDLFERQSGGRVRMVDRKKYLIKTGGENVYPLEVEQVLMRREEIADAAVFGVPDDRWGEIVVACVVLKAGSAPEPGELSEWVARHIAGYKKPRRIHFVEHIPRNVSGKILKGELAASYRR